MGERRHEGMGREFYHHGRAWYAGSVPLRSGVVDEVFFGFYAEEGGTSGELGMRWHDLSSNDGPSPRLECFNDAWSTLGELDVLIADLAQLDSDDTGHNITPAEFCALLEGHGFTDKTQTVRPDDGPQYRRSREEIENENAALQARLEATP